MSKQEKAQKEKEEELEVTSEQLEQETVENQKATTDNDSSKEETPSEVEVLKKELEGLKDKHLRLIAEYDNYKRRTLKERAEYLKTAGKDVIIDMLPVLDDFDRASDSIEKATDLEAVKQGFTLVKEKIFSILGKKGLQEVEAKGLEFDSDQFEAITEIPAGEEMAGKVVDVVTKGYTLNSSIIRFAQVVVGQKQS